MNLCKSEHLKEFTDEKTRKQFFVSMPPCEFEVITQEFVMAKHGCWHDCAKPINPQGPSLQWTKSKNIK